MAALNPRIVARIARTAGRVGIIINEHTLGRDETVLLVDALSRWFEFIALDDLPARLESPRRTPFCLLTFDDGKKSNATVTAPALRRLGVPAVFYVVSDFLSQEDPLWFDAYDALMERFETTPPGLERDALKKLPHKIRMARLRHEIDRLGVSVPTSEDVQPMSWDEARRLAAEGFAIGAHGVSHAILTRESRETAFHEIADSLARVSRELGEPCRSFAFPNGNYDAALSRHAAACGATTVMTTDPTWVDGRTPLWCLPRIQLYGSSDPRHALLKIALAAVPGALLNPDGTGRSYYSTRRAFREAGKWEAPRA
jgi:peptidoglycan/xylan/chitin deacetylase (PgdA/CDA1 family)